MCTRKSVLHFIKTSFLVDLILPDFKEQKYKIFAYQIALFIVATFTFTGLISPYAEFFNCLVPSPAKVLCHPGFLSRPFALQVVPSILYGVFREQDHLYMIFFAIALCFLLFRVYRLSIRLQVFDGCSFYILGGIWIFSITVVCSVISQFVITDALFMLLYLYVIEKLISSSAHNISIFVACVLMVLSKELFVAAIPLLSFFAVAYIFFQHSEKRGLAITLMGMTFIWLLGIIYILQFENTYLAQKFSGTLPSSGPFSSASFPLLLDNVISIVYYCFDIPIVINSNYVLEYSKIIFNSPVGIISFIGKSLWILLVLFSFFTQKHRAAQRIIAFFAFIWAVIPAANVRVTNHHAIMASAHFFLLGLIGAEKFKSVLLKFTTSINRTVLTLLFLVLILASVGFTVSTAAFSATIITNPDRSISFPGALQHINQQVKSAIHNIIHIDTKQNRGTLIVISATDDQRRIINTMEFWLKTSANTWFTSLFASRSVFINFDQIKKELILGLNVDRQEINHYRMFPIVHNNVITLSIEEGNDALLPAIE